MHSDEPGGHPVDTRGLTAERSICQSRFATSILRTHCEKRHGTLTIKTLETETPTGTVPVDQGGPFVQTGVWVITSPTGVYNGVTGSGTTVWNGGTVTLSLTGVMTKLN